MSATVKNPPVNARKINRNKKKKMKKQLAKKQQFHATVVHPPDPKQTYKKKTGAQGMVVGIAPQLPVSSYDTVPNEVTTINWKSYISDEAVNSVIAAIVQYVSLYGYSVLGDGNYPFYLGNYLKGILVSVISQTTPATASGPRFLHILAQMLTPSKVKWKTGHINYNWDTSSLTTVFPDQVAQLKFTKCGTPQSGSYGFGVLDISPPTYTVENGLAAYMSFISFCANNRPDSLMATVENILADLPQWKRDVSVFSVTRPQVTNCVFNLGGQDAALSNPKKIVSPISAVFVSATASDGFYTSSVESYCYSTTPRYFANRLLSLEDPFMLRSKMRSLFKPVDVNDVFDLLSNIIGRAFEKQATFNGNNAQFQPCPLTGPEVFMILRALVSVIAGGDYASDYLGFNNFFFPMQYAPAQADVTLAVSTMNLPTFLIENLRDLGLATIDGFKAHNNDPKYKNQCMLWVPVFGTYDPTRAVYDYDVTINGVVQPLYSPVPPGTPGFRQDDLNVYNTNFFICPTGNALSSAVGIWNNWVSNLTNCVQLSPFAAQKAESCLGLLAYTRYCKPEEIGAESAINARLQLERHGMCFDNGLECYKVPVVRTNSKGKGGDFITVPTYRARLGVAPKAKPSGGTNDYSEYAVSANQRFKSSLLTYVNLMILPKILLSFDYQDIQTNAIIQQQSTLYYEPYAIYDSKDAQSPGFTPRTLTLQQKWAAVADYITVPGVGLEANEWVKVHEQLRKNGNGGWLGTLLGDTAAAMTGIPFLKDFGLAMPF